MAQKFELNELKENKVLPLKCVKGQRVSHSNYSMTFNGKYSNKSVWSINKVPVLEIVSSVPGAWRILAEDHQILGYYFQPKEPSPFRWEIRYEY